MMIFFFFFGEEKRGEESKIRNCKWWASYAMDTPARLHQAAPWQTCVATVECAHEKKRSSSFFALALLACFAANHAEARVEARLRGQNSVAKFGFVKKGLSKVGKFVKKKVRKARKFVKKKVRKVKSWFSKDKKTIKEKFVLTSAGGGTRAFSALLRLRKDTKKMG